MYENALDYFAGEELPANVFLDKYALRDREDKILEKTPDDMHRRIAREFARIEAKKFKKPYSEEFVYGLLKDFGLICPQGSPCYGIGNPQYITLSNCYVSPSPTDSYSGIHHTDEILTQISKRRGGVGIDVSAFRPNNFPTTNAARKATGVVGFCERFSNSIREVGQNGRRGALMLTIDIAHPEALAFARMKLDPKKVTGANVSIRLSNEFMLAVENGGKFEQRWPCAIDEFEAAKRDGKPHFSQMVDAKEVWLEIIKCAHARAEPGLLFWDLILKESTADCYGKHGFNSVSTNPCSELVLCVLDSCRLLLLNLFSFVRNPFTSEAKFDFKKFYEHAQIAQRLMDDLIDLELECIERILQKVKSDPEPDHIKARELWLWEQIRQKCEQGRRTGTGITALADAMAGVGIRYGSDESIQFTEQVYRTLKFGCYKSSVDMAEELGPFPIWEYDAEKDSSFLNRLKGESVEIDGEIVSGSLLYRRMKKVGRRNIALLTTSPAGTISILAGPRPYFGTTSGIEPLFTDEPYTRRKKITPGMQDARVDFVDAMGDKWTEFKVFHPKIRQWVDVTGERDWKKSPYHGCTANDLDWPQRVKLQAAATRHLEHSVSSTLNLPEDVSVEKVAEIYETAWRAGCKGITVYRDKCRDGVLVKEPTKLASDKKSAARPQELPCDIYFVSVKKEPFVVLVGMLNGLPYEVFAFAKQETDIEAGRGWLQKVSKSKYKLLSHDKTMSCFVTPLANDTEAALTRMISVSIRHGADVTHIVEQLQKVEGNLTSFSKAIARTLKRYIADGTVVVGSTCEKCGIDALVYQEGCQTCRNCGQGKCG